MTSSPLPLVRLDNADPDLLGQLLAAVERVARAAAFTLGDEVEAFEREFAAYCAAPDAVAVSSGTDALALTFRGLGLGTGDEVLVPANSYIATAEAVTLTGATPRFIDVDEDTGTVTADIVGEAIGLRTRCVVPVHLHGRTVDMDPLLEVAARAGIAVVEDACQAHGALYRGRPAGSLGDAGCFSFYPSKNLGAWGDGGAVVTNVHALADRIRLLRSHGQAGRDRHVLPGTTARLDGLQAAVLRVKLARLDGWNRTRRRLATALSEALADGPVRPPVPPTDGEDHVFHHYVVRCDDRDGLRAHLAERGIDTAVHYPVPIHRSQAYGPRAPGSLPAVEQLADEICSLPLFPSMGETDVERLAAAVLAFNPAVATAH